MVSGTVVAPNAAATPVAGDLVQVYVDNAPASGGGPTMIGTATTDANGNWTFALPAYAALPAAAQAVADANDGYLNVLAATDGTATMPSGAKFEVLAVGNRSGWVGSGAGGTAPAAGNSQAQPLMVMRPNPPTSTSPTTASAAAAALASSQAVTTDTSGNAVLGNPDNAYSAAPTDAYGYQELAGNGSYNPNIGPDGTTDITNAAISSKSNCCGTKDNCEFNRSVYITEKKKWTVVGEYHGNWNERAT